MSSLQRTEHGIFSIGGAMGCGQCEGIETLFSSKWVTKDLKSYRERGPGGTARVLIRALREKDVRGMTLLDVGGGVGAIHHELIKSGLKAAVDVDASTTYLSAARSEALRQGHSDKVTYRHGDFVDLAPTIEPADIVTLDRVICCYDDMTSLVDLTAQRALRYYGLAYPREAAWVRLGIAVENLWQRARRCPYRAFLHSTRAVEEILSRHDLKLVSSGHSAFWQVAIYAR